MKRAFVTQLFCLTLSLISLAQTRISGVIRNTEGAPLPFATVFIEDMKIGTAADSLGRFEMKNVKSGTHTFHVSFIGHKTVEQVITVEEKQMSLDFALEEEVVSLDEMVILPNGMDFPHFLMDKLEKNIKPLKKRISSYDCTVTAHLDKAIDLKTLRKRKTIRFAMLMVGWAKIFDIMMKYPDFAVDMAEDVHFNKGSIKSSTPRIIGTTPKLTDKELKAVMKKDWFLDKNQYDGFYDLVEKKIKSLKSKNSKYDVTYGGSYEEDGRRVYILRYGRTQIELVEGCWQIRRMKYKSSSRTIYFEFQQLVKDVYLPVAGHAEYNIDYDGYPKGKVRMAMGMEYSNIR